MPYRLDPNTGQFVWDGSSIPQTTRDSLGTQIRELQAQIDALSFVDLNGVPTTYTGQSGKILSVKSSEDGLEFVAKNNGGIAWVAGQNYVIGTIVTVGTTAYVATQDHASGAVDEPGVGQEWESVWEVSSGGSGGVTDGDKGDVVVSGSGTAWTLDTSGVTAGSYTLLGATIDAKGRITAASNGTVSSATISDGSTVGRNILTLTNPGAVTFLRMNANDSVTARTASETRTDLGLGGAALLAVGTTTGTVAAGDDARFHSAASVGVTLQSVMDFSGQNLYAVTTPIADRIVFFDQSEGTWEYLEAGSGLSITGQTITAAFNPAAPGAIGGTTPSTAVFTTAEVRTELDIQSTSGSAGPILSWNTPTTEATNWERARMAWSSNVFTLSTERNGTGVAHPIEIAPGGVTAARFTTDGRTVMNGTTAASSLTRITMGTPSSALSSYASGLIDQSGIVASTDGSNCALFENTKASGSGQGAFASLYSSDGAAMASGDRLGGFLIGGSSSSSNLRNACIAEAYATQTWVDGSAYGSAWNFATTANGGTSRTGKMWINGDGNVGIGNAVFSVSVAPTARVQIRGAGTGTGVTLLVENSSGTARFTVRDDGAFAFAGGTVAVAETGWTTFTNLTTDRTCDANATTVEELADILGTLIVALKNKGILAN
jgi:hypothetical protein